MCFMYLCTFACSFVPVFMCKGTRASEYMSGRIALVYHYLVDATVLSSDGKGHINSVAASSHVEDLLLQEISAVLLHCSRLRERFPV